MDNEETIRNEAWRGAQSGIAKQPHGDESRYRPTYNVQWTESRDSNPRLTAGISDPKPDYSESFRLTKYPSHAHDALGAHLGPTSYAQAMPAFAAECKRTSFSIASAAEQAAYDGAIMVSSARAAHEYLRRPFQYNSAQALTAAYNGDYLALHAHHAVENHDGEPDYHSYELYHHRPSASLEEYKASRRHTRNAQDWSRERAGRTLDELRKFIPVPALATPPVSSSSGPAVQVTRQSTPPPPTAGGGWSFSEGRKGWYRRCPDGTYEWHSEQQEQRPTRVKRKITKK